MLADAKSRFSSRAADYARYRPGYPAALLDLLRNECGLLPHHVIADVGSGTGLLSKLLLENGNSVFGVEPNAEMRAGGEDFLLAFPKFTSVDGSAEATTLPESSADFITAGQAFHWFDPVAARREFRRILKAAGWAVIAWNDRCMEESTLTSDYENLLERFGIDYKTVKDSYPERAGIQTFFRSGEVFSRDLPNFQLLDLEALCGRLRSSSFAPREGHLDFAPMMAALERIFRAHQRSGQVRMEYFTRVYFGRFGSAP